MYSAITDDPLYFEAREHSPVEKNWTWTLPLKGALKVVHDLDMNNDHELQCIHEQVVADDKILPRLQEETERRQVTPSPHPVTANNGPELLKEFGFFEIDKGEVIWK